MDIENLTNEDLKTLYTRIYKSGNPKHPSKGVLQKYGSHNERDHTFLKWLRSKLPKGSVLDASCGRGHLLRSLVKMGYEARGTEIVEWLKKEDLSGLDVDILDYDGLPSLGENRFDAVISNDVLEHLVDEEMVERAIRNLCFVSKRYVLISAGTKNARKYPAACNLPIPNLHLIKHKADWWKETVSKYVDVSHEEITRSGWFGFGDKKCLT
jgi:SAM-dependent methyltransferase